jgi:hypothetical protein
MSGALRAAALDLCVLYVGCVCVCVCVLFLCVLCGFKMYGATSHTQKYLVVSVGAGISRSARYYCAVSDTVLFVLVKGVDADLADLYQVWRR